MIRKLYTLIPHPRLLLRLGALTAIQSVLQGLLLGSLIPILNALLREDPDFAAASPWLIAAAIGLIVYGVLTVLATPVGFAASTEASSGLRQRLVQHAANLPVGWFTSRNKARLSRALTADAGNVGQLAVSIGGPAITALLTPATIIAITATVDWRIATLLALIMAVALLALRRAGRISSAIEIELEDAAAQIATRAVELGQAQPVLRAAGLGKSGSRLMRDALERHRQVYRRGLRQAMVPDLTYTAVVLAGLVSVLVLCAALFADGRLGVPETIALLILAIRFQEPLSHLIELIGALHAMDNSIARIQDVLAVPPLPARAKPVAASGASGVVFTAVSFTYPGAPTAALGDLTFTCPAGSTTALIGPSGSGKTTVTRLIARFFDVDSGSVTIGGIDVRDHGQAELLDNIAIVFQDVYLFDDTIEANLRIARPDATDDDLAHAAAAARLNEVIDRLPDGWDTGVGEGGSKLSGGERQRVSIARAFLKDAPIVLIDEAASALDPENERAVSDAIARIARDPHRTVIVIAHRPATLQTANQVVALDHGRIVETGIPAELQETDGLYSRLYNQYAVHRSWRIAKNP